MSNVRIATSFGAQPATGATTIDVKVGYDRTGGQRIILAARQFAFTSETQEVTLSVDLATCLNDPDRAGPANSCPLRVAIALLDATGATLDSDDLGPFDAVPGGTAEVAAALTATTGTLAFCTTSPDDRPIWFAVQNGTSGQWAQVAVNGTASSLTFPFGNVGGISFVVANDDGGFSHETIFLTRAELIQLPCFGNDDAFGSKTLNGFVSGLGPNDLAEIAVGGARAFVFPGPQTNFTLVDVPDGARDLVAGRSSTLSSGYMPNRYIVRREINPPSGATLATLNFTGTESLAPDTGQYTVAGIGTDQWFAGTEVLTANSTFALLGIANGTGTGASVAIPYQGLNASQRLATDVYMFFASASAGDSERGVDQRLQSFGSRSVTLGPALSVPTVTTVATSPNLRMRAQFSSQAAYAAGAAASFLEQGTVTREAFVFATAGYFGGTPATWDLAIPDQTAAGFQTIWGLQSGGTVSWIAEAASFLPEVGPASETPSLYAVHRFGFGGAALSAGARAAPRRLFGERLLGRRR